VHLLELGIRPPAVPGSIEFDGFREQLVQVAFEGVGVERANLDGPEAPAARLNLRKCRGPQLGDFGCESPGIRLQ
jgi:hypothetical protein